MATILVIDDETLVRGTLRRILTKAGHAVVEADDGKRGLIEFARECPDLVICDILMPNKEGLETIRELRQTKSAVPILAISGGGRLGTSDFLRFAKGLGANAALSKPFSADEIVETVGSLLAAA